MAHIQAEISAFLSRKRETGEHASQRAAFFLASGMELDDALGQRGEARKHTVMRLERLLERERLKGARSHWSYDLNRHIALKQALDMLRGRDGADAWGRARIARHAARKKGGTRGAA